MRINTILTILLSFAALLFFAGCNADGAGIFYTINTEVKQTGGDFPMVNQVVEAGGNIYIRTGNSVRRFDGDGSWDVVKKKNVDSIATDGTDIYAMIAESISSDNSTDSYIKYSGDNWSSKQASYSNDSTMITMDESNGTEQYMVVRDSTNYLMDRLNNSVATSDTGIALPGNELPIDGAIIDDGANHTYYAIGKELDSDNNAVTKLYKASASDDFTSLSSASTISGISGNLRTITAEEIGGTDYLFFTTYGPSNDRSRVYAYNGGLEEIENTDIIGSDNTQVSNGSPDSLRVVWFDNGSHPYLIVGAADGYYEVDLSGNASDWSLSRPSATVDIASDSSLGAKYPDLAVSYVFSVYQPDPTEDIFYLGVGKESGNILGGLWKHESDGGYAKQ